MGKVAASPPWFGECRSCGRAMGHWPKTGLGRPPLSEKERVVCWEETIALVGCISVAPATFGVAVLVVSVLKPPFGGWPSWWVGILLCLPTLVLWRLFGSIRTLRRRLTVEEEAERSLLEVPALLRKSEDMKAEACGLKVPPKGQLNKE